MTLSGTFHLSESANDRYQFIYSTLYNGDSESIYANLQIEDNLVKGISLLLVNYNQGTEEFITDFEISVSNGKTQEPGPFNLIESRRTGRDVTPDHRQITPIKCITLIVDLTKNLRVANSSANVANQQRQVSRHYDISYLKHRIAQGEKIYLEVMRSTDEVDEKEDYSPKYITKCFKQKGKGILDSPGKICPRGYSLIVI